MLLLLHFSLKFNQYQCWVLRVNQLKVETSETTTSFENNFLIESVYCNFIVNWMWSKDLTLIAENTVLNFNLDSFSPRIYNRQHQLSINFAFRFSHLTRKLYLNYEFNFEQSSLIRRMRICWLQKTGFLLCFTTDYVRKPLFDFYKTYKYKHQSTTLQNCRKTYYNFIIWASHSSHAVANLQDCFTHCFFPENAWKW